MFISANKCRQACIALVGDHQYTTVCGEIFTTILLLKSGSFYLENKYSMFVFVSVK